MGEVLERRRLLAGGVPEVRRGQLWELTLEGGTQERETRLAEMALLESRARGLLANPEVEEARLWVEPPPASAVVEALFSSDRPADLR